MLVARVLSGGVTLHFGGVAGSVLAHAALVQHASGGGGCCGGCCGGRQGARGQLQGGRLASRRRRCLDDNGRSVQGLGVHLGARLANGRLHNDGVVVLATVAIANVPIDGVAVVGAIAAQTALVGGSGSVYGVVLHHGRLALVGEVAAAAAVQTAQGRRGRGAGGGGEGRGQSSRGRRGQRSAVQLGRRYALYA